VVSLLCELCGSEEAVTKMNVEGAQLHLCSKCSGVREMPVAKVVLQTLKPMREEPTIVIREDFSKIIRASREKMNLTQEQVAVKISEKSNVVKRIEEGWEPPFSLLEKLERFFKVSLKEGVADTKIKTKSEKKSLTIGDVLEVR